MSSGIRIIGGRWRGRKLAVVDAAGLRPTPDRIRETLFNWLAADCRGAEVLDCFAGSGALGFEALSRGARRLVAIETQPVAVAGLREAVASLGAEEAEVIKGDALTEIEHLAGSFDIVFVDPPYAEGHMRKQVLERLAESGRLQPGARVYLEWPVSETFELPGDDWEWHRRKTAGRVHYAIAEWQGSG